MSRRRVRRCRSVHHPHAGHPIWNRAGLIIDVRHNRGGNIDSWIISRLLRKAWAYWSTRVSDFSTWNMQYAFRGHVVIRCAAGTDHARTPNLRRRDSRGDFPGQVLAALVVRGNR